MNRNLIKKKFDRENGGVFIIEYVSRKYVLLETRGFILAIGEHLSFRDTETSRTLEITVLCYGENRQGCRQIGESLSKHRRTSVLSRLKLK